MSVTFFLIDSFPYLVTYISIKLIPGGSGGSGGSGGFGGGLLAPPSGARSGRRHSIQVHKVINCLSVVVIL